MHARIVAVPSGDSTKPLALATVLADSVAEEDAGSQLSFPRSARLLSAADYSQVFGNSQRFSDRHWTILVRTCDKEQPRLGLAIAKKRAKRAVDRNKIKRIARESFRHHLDSLVHRELVIMNRDAAAKADTRVLRVSLDRLMRKIAGNTLK